jgi:hypothetical protein
MNNQCLKSERILTQFLCLKRLKTIVIFSDFNKTTISYIALNMISPHGTFNNKYSLKTVFFSTETRRSKINTSACKLDFCFHVQKAWKKQR